MRCLRPTPLTAVLLTALALPAAASPRPVAAAQEQAVAETIVLLRHLTPSEAIWQLKQTHRVGPDGKPGADATFPAGVVSVTGDDKKNALYVKGTRDGIKTVMQLLPLLDVAPRQVLIRARLIQVGFGPDGSLREKVLQAPTITTTANRTGEMKVKGNVGGTPVRETKLAFTPRLNEAGNQITLLVKLGMAWEDKTSDGIERAVVLQAGQKQRVAGLTNAKDPRLRKAVAVGQTPSRWTGAFTVYYVEVEAEEVKDRAAGTMP